MWGYWWGYTAAQIELMAIDQPLIVYGHKKDKKKGFKKANELKLAKAKAKHEGASEEERQIKLNAMQERFSQSNNKQKEE